MPGKAHGFGDPTSRSPPAPLDVCTKPLAVAARGLVRAATAELAGEPAQLRRANATLNLGMTGSAALGPAAAGLLVAGFGAPAALLLDAASFLVVAALFPRGLRLPATRAAGGWRARLADAASYVRREPAVRGLLAVQALALVFFTAVLPVEVVFAKATLGAGDAGYGILLTAWGAGMV